MLDMSHNSQLFLRLVFMNNIMQIILFFIVFK